MDLFLRELQRQSEIDDDPSIFERVEFFLRRTNENSSRLFIESYCSSSSVSDSLSYRFLGIDSRSRSRIKNIMVNNSRDIINEYKRFDNRAISSCQKRTMRRVRSESATQELCIGRYGGNSMSWPDYHFLYKTGQGRRTRLCSSTDRVR